MVMMIGQANARRRRALAAALVLVSTSAQVTIVNQINVSAAVASVGFPVAGGETVFVGADNLPLGQPLTMVMRSALFPGDLACGCTLRGSPASSTPGMAMACGPSPSGWGTNFSLLFFGSGASPFPLRAANPPNNVFAFAGPVVTSVSVLTGGSSTSGSALPLKKAGPLMIDLTATDYDAAHSLWDNHATPGAPSTSNGDFGVLSFPGGQRDIAPTAAVVGSIQSVVFTFGTKQTLSTLSTPTGGPGLASPSLFQGMYGGNAWTVEALVYPQQPSLTSEAYETGAEMSFFQWGQRPANNCNGGHLGLGHNPVYGAGGMYFCDLYYSPGPSTVFINDQSTTSGYRPIPNVWHHIVWTYTGTASTGILSVYIDGALSTAVGRALNILQVPNLHIGSWWNTAASTGAMSIGQAASFALNFFRVHTGALPAADVTFNFQQFSATLLSAGVVGFTGASGPMALATAGYQRVLLSGVNFGPPGNTNPVTVTYTAALAQGVAITYPAGVDATLSNTTALIVTTSPGVGPNVSFTITIAGGPVGSGAAGVTATTGPIAAYAPPVLTTFSPVGGGSFVGGVANPNGGDTFSLTGSTFGPLSLPGVPAYTPTVTYGTASGRFTAVNCQRSPTSPDTILTCQTAPGAGRNWPLAVCVGNTGWCSAIAATSPPSVSYPAPTITSVFGALRMSTAGGERLVATGSNLGSPSTIGVYSVLLQYGPAALAAAGTWLYNGTGCGLESASASNNNMQVGCTTVPGVGGAGFVARLVIGDTASNVLPAATAGLGFAAPVIQTVSGPGAVNGATVGNQAVAIAGLNFGYANSVLNVSYTLQLQGPVPGVTAVAGDGSFSPNVVTYTPASCNITVPHTQITCLTTPGAGASMSWHVVVNGVANAYPTSSYAPPTVTDFAVFDAAGLGLLPGGASAAGNSTLEIRGSGFGVPANTSNGAIRLLQLVTLVSPSGARTALPPWAVVSLTDAAVRVLLPPGSGAGWTAVVRVADRESQPPPANVTFTYAVPSVSSVTCGGGGPATGSTQGGASCVVLGSNFPLLDPLAIIVVFFGNPADGSLYPAALPTTPAPPGVAFTVPPGSGVARAVRLVSYRVGDAAPNPLTFRPPPLPAVSVCAAPGCAGTFSYTDPMISA